MPEPSSPRPVLPFDPAPESFRVATVAGVRDGVCLCPLGAACGSPGKHPFPQARGWMDRLLTSRGEVVASLASDPDLNFGMVVGREAGLLVLDLDSPEVVAAASQLGVPKTWTVVSGRGNGLHVYFRHPDRDVSNANLPFGEVKASGYVVAPGSMHRSGNRYRWAPGRSPADLPLADAPAWLLSRLQERIPQSPRSVVSVVDGEERVSEFRHVRLARIAGQLKRHGCAAPEIRRVLTRMNREGFTVPLPEPDRNAIVRDVMGRQTERAVFREQLGVLRAALELHGHRLDLDAVALAALIDGHFLHAWYVESLDYATSFRLLPYWTNQPKTTVEKATKRLMAEGFVERTQTGRLGKSRYQLQPIAIRDALVRATPYLRHDFTFQLPEVAGVHVSNSLLCWGSELPLRRRTLVESASHGSRSVGRDGSTSMYYPPPNLMYVPLVSHLRLCYPLGLDRTLIVLLGQYPDGLTREQIGLHLSYSKRKANRALEALRASEAVETVDGVHRLCEDAEDALQRVWEASSEKAVVEERNAEYRDDVIAFVAAAESYDAAHSNPVVSWITSKLDDAGPGLHDLTKLLAPYLHHDGDREDLDRIEGVGLVDTKTGEVID